MRAEMVLGRSRQPLIYCTIRMKMRWPTGSSLTLARSDFVISAENDLAHLGCLSGQFVDQSRTGFRVAESGLG